MNYKIKKKLKIKLFLWFLLLAGFFPTGCETTGNESLANEYFVIGNDYYEMGNYEKAEEFFLKAIAIDPGFKKLNYNLARVYLENGKYAIGREILFELLEPDKENQKLIETIGYSYYLEKKYDKAAEYYGQVLDANKMDKTARYNLGIIRKNKKEYEGALELLLSLEEEKITDIKTLTFNIAEIYQELKQPEKAVEYYEKSLSQFPDKKMLLEKLIAYYNQEKLYNKVIEKMDDLTPLLPADKQAEHLFQKGELTLLKNDDYSKGLETIKEALTKGYDNKMRFRKLLKEIDDPDIRDSLKEIQKNVEEENEKKKEKENEKKNDDKKNETDK